MSSPRSAAAVVVVMLFAGHGDARADVRITMRLGVEPVALEASTDTPFVGGHVDDAVSAYNAAASAYNRAHGYAAGSAMASAPIDRGALGLHTTLLTLAPGLEAGADHVKFRIEGLVGLSDRVHALGVGLYPLDLTLPLRDSAVTPYVVAGGTARWLGRSDTDGQTGGLVALRAAAGVRVGRHAVVEIGYGVVMLGGLYDGAALRSMSSYDPRGSAPPPAPDRVVTGGIQWGMIDVSAGFVL